MIIMRFLRKNRISIDLDSFNQFNLLKSYYNLKHCFDNVLVKETMHGYHIMAYKKDRTLEENMHFRLMHNDCIGRLGLDTNKMIYDRDSVETLFMFKNQEGKKGGEVDIDILSKPFWGNTKLRINRR